MNIQNTLVPYTWRKYNIEMLTCVFNCILLFSKMQMSVLFHTVGKFSAPLWYTVLLLDTSSVLSWVQIPEKSFANTQVRCVSPTW
jgi:hypothetical protein